MYKKWLNIIGIYLLFNIPLAYGLIAPLNPEALKNNADQVLVGKVISVEPKEVTKPYGVDTVYTVTLKVDNTEKGEKPTSETINFTFWKAKERPQGWAGNYGQNVLIYPDTHIRVYLKQTEDNELKLLEPNGFEKIFP